MCCPTYDQLNANHIHCLNRMRTSPSLEEAASSKTVAATAWAAVIQHRRDCSRCRVRSNESQSSAGMPVWQSGLY